jgi:di/tricarboxylate transporter
MTFSKEYVSAIVIILVSSLRAFGFDLGGDTATAIVTGVVALVIAVARYRKGDISLGGVKS